MNILVPDSWLRSYLQTDATPKQIKDCLSLCGPSIERINTEGDHVIYDIEITSNRIDMASIYGIAKEAAAILPRFGIPATLLPLPIEENTSLIPETSKPIALDIQDPDSLCHRLLAIVIDNVQMSKTPTDMKQNIEASGIRSLQTLIDITNYVMLEVGHPCHVFDYDRIKTAKILVRYAKKNERITTLDEKTYSLSPEDIIIDDGTGRIIDLPGIMGASNSVVTDQTKRIVVFIESNDPVRIRRTSMRYGIRTYAATINEKHPDPSLAMTAMRRAIDLYKTLAKGSVASNLIDIYPHPKTPSSISVTIPFINQRLGIKLEKKEITQILRSLEFQVTEPSHDTLLITPPSSRQHDVQIQEDIVEEVARMYGYHKLPGTLMDGMIPVLNKIKTPAQSSIPREKTIKHLLKGWGYTEVYTYSFISKHMIEKTGLNVLDHLPVANPLTEEITHMRTSMIPSMLSVIEKNQHTSSSCMFFECSAVYEKQKTGLPKEKQMLIIASTTSYREIKGVVEQLLCELRLKDIVFKRSQDSDMFHPHQSAHIIANGTHIGTIGSIHPTIATSWSLKQGCFIATLPLDSIATAPQCPQTYVPISQYPLVHEDFTLQVPPHTEIGTVIEDIRISHPHIESISLLGTYQSSVTLRAAYQDPHKNLTGEDTKKIRETILSTLEKKYQIYLKS